MRVSVCLRESSQVYRRGELMSWELLKPEEDGV